MRHLIESNTSSFENGVTDTILSLYLYTRMGQFESRFMEILKVTFSFSLINV